MKSNSPLFANRGGQGGGDSSSRPSGTTKSFKAKLFSYSDSASKYDGYLLNENHPQGGSKAKFLKQTLGYSKGDGKALHAAISDAIDGRIPNNVEKTSHGTKYKFDTKIRGKDGAYHKANVTVVIQNDNGKITWRLITLTPGKKDK